MNFTRNISVLFLAVFMVALAVAEDQVELTLGFHSRNPDHPLKGLEAACIGIEGVRSPVDGGSELITPTADTLLSEDSMVTPRWELRGEPALRVEIVSWFNPHARPVDVQLYDADGNIVATLSNNRWVWEAASEDELPVVAIEGVGQFSASGETDNKGTHVVLAISRVSMEVEIPDNPMFRNVAKNYLDGQSADVDLKISPAILTAALANTSIQLTEGGGWNPSNKLVTFERRGEEHEWRIPNCRWFRNRDDCNKVSTWKFEASGTVNMIVVTAEGEHEVSLGPFLDARGDEYISGSQYGEFVPGEAYLTPSQRRIGFHPWYLTIKYEPKIQIRHGATTVRCLRESQWFDLVQSEELRHRRQFTGPDGWGRVVPTVLREYNRGIDHLVRILNSNLRRRSFDTYEEAMAAGEPVVLSINALVNNRVERLNSQLRDESSLLRCRIEAEAKGPHPWGVNMPAPFNMACTYTQCPTDLRGVRAFQFNLPVSVQ